MEKEEKTPENLEEATDKNEQSCPECGGHSLIIAGRCATCSSCGWSLCSM